MHSFEWTALNVPESTTDSALGEGSRVAIIGGGPAGSFFAYFLLEFATRVGTHVNVDIYEARDFLRPAPHGCNMCGGIISETLVQILAAEGINLPSSIVERGIDSYVLHMDVGTVRIETPLHEKRIASVQRGGGPRDINHPKKGSFDAHLLRLAVDKGAKVIHTRVREVGWNNGRPQIRTGPAPADPYDLLVVATGVNAGSSKLAQELGVAYQAPKTVKTYIQEHHLGEETVSTLLGSSMHVFLLNIPGLEFAAIIPKGDYAKVCLLGSEISDALVRNFLDSEPVRCCLPPEQRGGQCSCHCAPRINVCQATQPFADRVVFVGDCATTRLYKDGIGAAYRTGKAAARTAMFHGVSAEAFRRHYDPVCQTIARDNRIGKFTFAITRVFQKMRFARRAIWRITANEQGHGGRKPRMSTVLWDMFTGSSSYASTFFRTLHPAFVGMFAWNLLVSVVPRHMSVSVRRRRDE